VFDKTKGEKIFRQFMALSQIAFTNGLYESAYHALDAAFYCACALQSASYLHSIEKVATEQSAWIDLHDPGSVMSTQSSPSRRRGVSFYQLLMRKASIQAEFIHNQEWQSKQFPSS
jgi:hypothetical protein